MLSQAAGIGFESIISATMLISRESSRRFDDESSFRGKTHILDSFLEYNTATFPQITDSNTHTRCHQCLYLNSDLEFLVIWFENLWIIFSFSCWSRFDSDVFWDYATLQCLHIIIVQTKALSIPLRGPDRDNHYSNTHNCRLPRKTRLCFITPGQSDIIRIASTARNSAESRDDKFNHEHSDIIISAASRDWFSSANNN